jgi:hypothetical protein
MKPLTVLQKKDIKLLGKFIEVYCNGRHGTIERTPFSLPDSLGNRLLCTECTTFMQYATRRRINCPLEAEKPTCKHCRTHCYAKPQLEKVKEIMAYSGKKLMMRGRLDYIWHYFF